MSGRPNTVQVEELRRALRTQTDMRVAIAQIELQRAACDRELLNANQILRNASEKIFELLHSMDCYGSGNAGWETRYVALLSLLAEKEKA